ncbi:DUF4136 domain-containing protein [Rufibacter hautae]|uniref:DUF4136 domain-containing protein n=1 Tax=Rufibacter hautae TaxID=2595005 RepID=A0A5B6TDZ9_9BACT|nr:DUF4136 domain-containing protein [Rufibacter hautae]KAA3438131.1 DUF4136 domain-containing protein [Rufibacter hautae]
MNKIIIHSLALYLLLLTVSCSPVRVTSTEASPDFRLTNYKTFGFMEVNADSSRVEIPAEHIASLQREVSNQLQKRGLTMSNANPDLLVNLGVVVQEKKQTRQTDFRTDAPYYMGQRRYTWRSKEVEVGRYKQGTISVHLVDRDQNSLVWSNQAESVVPSNNSKVQERIAEGVEKLFESLPTAGQ